MSYTVLARRYRSTNFDEIVGQEHIAQTLKKAIESGRIAHAYLFCGTRGTGKTSTARVLAKALNCEKYDRPTATPCGVCSSCQAIARGEDIDVIEIDAASHTGVDHVRDLIESSRNSPARSRFKVYIIDEVHMLSKSAFNALLKTLEEPPEHVKFILATTEPEKVLPTILSRCQRYDFHNIPTRLIAGHLKAICKKEKIEAEEDALLLLAKAGAGSMRDSLSLLDRMLSGGGGKLTAAGVEELLGLPKAQRVLELAQAIGASDVKKTLLQSDAILSAGMSADALLGALAEHFRNLLILRVCGGQTDLVQVPGVAPAELLKQAEKFAPLTLSQDITIVEELRRHLRQSPGNRALFDATLARLAMAEQLASIDDLLDRIDAEPAGSGEKKKPEPIEATSIDQPLPIPALAPAAKTETPELASIWPQFLKQVDSLGGAMAGAMALARPGSVVEGQAIIHLPGWMAAQWSNNGKRQAIAQILSSLLNQPMGVRFETDREIEGATALVEERAIEVARPEMARPELPRTEARAESGGRGVDAAKLDAVKNDPLVEAVLKQMGGLIIRVE